MGAEIAAHGSGRKARAWAAEQRRTPAERRSLKAKRDRAKLSATDQFEGEREDLQRTIDALEVELRHAKRDQRLLRKRVDQLVVECAHLRNVVRPSSTKALKEERTNEPSPEWADLQRRTGEPACQAASVREVAANGNGASPCNDEVELTDIEQRYIHKTRMAVQRLEQRRPRWLGGNLRLELAKCRRGLGCLAGSRAI